MLIFFELPGRLRIAGGSVPSGSQNLTSTCLEYGMNTYCNNMCRRVLLGTQPIEFSPRNIYTADQLLSTPLLLVMLRSDLLWLRLWPSKLPSWMKRALALPNRKASRHKQSREQAHR